MGNIIDILEYKNSLQFTKSQTQHASLQKQNHSHSYNEVQLYNCIDIFSAFNNDKSLLERRLNSNRHEYKFPTIISKYRRTVDVYSGLYLFLQEALFKYELHYAEYDWVISLFKDDEFKSKLEHKILADIKAINTFQHKYKAQQYDSIKNYLREIEITKGLYTHYISIFDAVCEMVD